MAESGRTPDVVADHRRAVERFGELVRSVAADQWSLPTPCAPWTVRDLVNHLVGEDRWTVPLLAGRTVAEVGGTFDGDLLGEDPRRAWDEAAAGALEAVGEPGVLDRDVSVSWGVISGAEYVTQLFSDHLVHGWDLARAIGADDRLDPDLVERCYAVTKPQEDDLKASGQFGDRIEPPSDADLQTRLLALFGRRP